MTKLYLAVHDGESDLRAHPFSTKALAEKSIADYIMESLTLEADDRAQEEMRECYVGGDYKGVMEVWNAWSIENEYREEFSVQEKVLDAPMAPPG